MEKILTSCCALCQMTASNDDSYEDLKAFVDNLKQESEARDYYGQPNDKGQRAIFCITTPNEPDLEKNLRKLSFGHTNTFNRRKGYPEGLLNMWMYCW